MAGNNLLFFVFRSTHGSPQADPKLSPLMTNPHMYRVCRIAFLLNRNVEKSRQRRSRPFAVLTYSPVRSARQSACSLAERTFLNIPKCFWRFIR